MQSRGLRDLHGIEHHRSVSVEGQGVAVPLIRCLGAVRRVGVTADVDDSRHGTVRTRRQVEIGGYVDLGHALESDFFDYIPRALDPAANLRVQRGLFAFESKAEHVLEFCEPLFTYGFPGFAPS